MLGNFQFRGALLIGIIIEQGSTKLAAGAGGNCLDFFSLASFCVFLGDGSI